MKQLTRSTLLRMREDLKQNAMYVGRYPCPHRAEDYDGRNKAKAFRCGAYNRDVRQINAIDDIIAEVERFKMLIREHIDMDARHAILKLNGHSCDEIYQKWEHQVEYMEEALRGEGE